MDRPILFITPFFSPNTGGVETFLDDLISYLNKRGVKAEVLTYQPLTTTVTAPSREHRDGNLIRRIPWIRGNYFSRFEQFAPAQLAYLGSGLGVAALVHLLRNRRRFSTVYCHGLAAGFIGFLCSLLVRKRYVLSLHTNYRFAGRPWLAASARRICGRFGSVLTLSKAARDDLETIGIEPRKLDWYRNWIDTDFFACKDRRECRERLGWDLAAFYALFVGRFSKEKGIFDLVRALPRLDPGIRLSIIGGGVGEEAVRTAVSRRPLTVYEGRKWPAELVDYLNAADILVYAPVDEDYLGRTAISALSCGCAVMLPKRSEYLGTRQPVNVIIPDGIGVVFENDPNSFATTLNEIHRSGRRFDRAACREYALKNFGEEANGAIILRRLMVR